MITTNIGITDEIDLIFYVFRFVLDISLHNEIEFDLQLTDCLEVSDLLDGE